MGKFFFEKIFPQLCIFKMNVCWGIPPPPRGVMTMRL